MRTSKETDGQSISLLLPKESDARLLLLLWFLTMKCKKKVKRRRRNKSLIKFENYAGKMPVVGNM